MTTKLGRLAACAILAAGLATPALAADETKPLAHLVMDHMAVSYMCRDDIGISHYQFARMSAVDTAVKAGMDRDGATVMVDKIDQSLRSHPNYRAPLNDEALCWELLNEAMYQLQVATARMNLDG